MQPSSGNSTSNDGTIGTQIAAQNVAGSVTNTYYLGSNGSLDNVSSRTDVAIREKAINRIVALAQEYASQEEAALMALSNQPVDFTTCLDEAYQSFCNTNAFDTWNSDQSQRVLVYYVDDLNPGLLRPAEQIAVGFADKLRSYDNHANQIFHFAISNTKEYAAGISGTIHIGTFACAVRNVLAQLAVLLGLDSEPCPAWRKDASFLAVFEDDSPPLGQTLRWLSALAAFAQQPATLVFSFDDRSASLRFPTSFWSVLRVISLKIDNLKLLLVGTITQSRESTGAVIVNQNSERQDCLNGLSFDEIDFYLERIPPAWSGTNEWFWSHPTLQAWRQSPSSILWIQGKPGSGKSVLSRTIIERGRMLGKPGLNDESIRSEMLWVSAYRWVYSRRFEVAYTDHVFMLRSFLHQLLSHDIPIFNNLRMLWRKIRCYLKHRDFKLVELQEMLRMAIRSIKRVQLFVIDGFDEGIQSSSASVTSKDVSREQILEFMVGLLRENHQLRIIILSRPEPDIELVLGEHAHCHTIVLQHENDKDIRLMIDEQLKILEHKLQRGVMKQQDLAGKVHQGSTTQSKRVINLIRSGRLHLGTSRSDSAKRDDTLSRIKEYVASNAQGVFLWVTVIFKELGYLTMQGLISWNDIEAVIKGLPTDLLEIYKAIVKDLEIRHSHAGITKAQRALEWVYVTSSMNGSFTLQDFRDALSIPPRNLRYNAEPVNDPFRDFQSVEEHWLGYRRSLYSLCGPFVDVVRPKGKDPESYGPFDLIQFVHTTARDFLAGPAAGHLQYSREKSDDNVRDDMFFYIKVSFPSWANFYCPLPARQGSHWEINISKMIEYLDSKPLLAFVLRNLPEAQDVLPGWISALGKAVIPAALLEEPYSRSQASKQVLDLWRYTMLFYTPRYATENDATHQMQQITDFNDTTKELVFAAALGKIFCDSCLHGCITTIQNLIALSRPSRHTSSIATELDIELSVGMGLLIAAIYIKDLPWINSLIQKSYNVLAPFYYDRKPQTPLQQFHSFYSGRDKAAQKFQFPAVALVQLALHDGNLRVRNFVYQRLLKSMQQHHPQRSNDALHATLSLDATQGPLTNLEFLPHLEEVNCNLATKCMNIVYKAYFRSAKSRWRRALATVRCIAILRLSWYDFAARHRLPVSK